MSKTPPHRRGISFEVGAQLEARDSLKNWYAANIEKIDYEDEKVLIHYKQWSHRYDEWFDWSSPYLRPVERIQLRKQGLHEKQTAPGFHVNQKVLASWSDCRYYPAKILSHDKDGCYKVKFFDGVVKTVKGIKVKPFRKESADGKANQQARKRSDQSNKEWKPKDNGRANGSTHSTSDQDGESGSERDDDDVTVIDESRNLKNGGASENGATKKPNETEQSSAEQKEKLPGEDVEEEPLKNREEENKTEKVENQEEKKANQEEKKANQEEKKANQEEKKANQEEKKANQEEKKANQEEKKANQEEKKANQEEKKANQEEKKANQEEKKANQEEKKANQEEKKANQEEKKANQEEKKGMNGEQEEKKPNTLQNGIDKSDGEKKATTDDGPSLPRRTRSKMADGKDAEKPSGPALRKRRASTGQMPPSKRSRANSSTDKNSRSQIKTPKSDSVPETSESKDSPTCPAGNPAPTEETGTSPDLAPALKQQVHLPTTNKYSREPLYRVIKNQPPPILSIELDHNPFKCKVTGCLKSFRKASLLHYHMKYYHAQTDPSPPQTRSSEKQNQETPRRRRTVSGSQHTPSPLSDSKSGHTLSPPGVGSMHRQRSSTLGSERSKENQHSNRSLHDDRDWVARETGVKERERLREKRQRDFFRIKLKKKKKKKRRSKSDFHSTEESIGPKPLLCNLNSALKLPPTLTHRSYMEPQPQKMLSQSEDSSSDLSFDSPVWSEEESDTELNLNMPLSEQGVEMRSHGSEIVRCICEVQEENDFMIQCDECLCWQHGTCMGLYEESVPDTYTCYICRDPPALRQSQRFWYDKDWLSSGHMYGLSFLEENYSNKNSKKVTAAHQLLGDVHRVFEVVNGLQLKMSILQTQAHPDLKLWRQPWKPADGLRRKMAGDSGVTTPFPPSPPDMGGSELDVLKSEVPSPVEKHCSFQDSYISSEHCYQKPRTYYPAVERRLVVETRGGSELEDSLRSTEDLLEMAEQRYGASLDHEQHKLQLADRSFTKELECRMKRLVSDEKKTCVVDIKEEEEPDPVTPDSKSDPDLMLHQQWQLNLLEHIEVVQDEVMHRMDLIERELDVLESWLDYTGELEPPDPLARLPQLKHRIRQLLTDLGKVQQIALCSSSS